MRMPVRWRRAARGPGAWLLGLFLLSAPLTAQTVLAAGASGATLSFGLREGLRVSMTGKP